MKVLKKGRPQKGWAKELECITEGGCSALLLVEEGDVYTTTFCSFDDFDTYHNFRCGACGLENRIKGRLPFDPPSKAEWLKNRNHVNIAGIAD